MKRNSKLNKLGAVDLGTGMIYEDGLEVFESVKKEEFSNRINRIQKCIRDKNIENISLDDIELIMKLQKRSINIEIDFKKNNQKYFTIKDNFNICRDLDRNTKSMLYEISQLITHDNTITTKNNIALTNYIDLCDYLGISNNIWKRYISKDNTKYSILKKEKINNNWYLVLNPLFAVKSRNITEYVFKCFYRELKEYLHPTDYLYLVKLHGIDPSNIYNIHQTNKKLEFVQ